MHLMLVLLRQVAAAAAALTGRTGVQQTERSSDQLQQQQQRQLVDHLLATTGLEIGLEAPPSCGGLKVTSWLLPLLLLVAL
jgi:N-acetylglutamate synthase/N-acetylornithine aminotransferase